MVKYVNHFEHLESDPVDTEWTPSLFEDVKEWHDKSSLQLAARADLKAIISLSSFVIVFDLIRPFH